MINAVSQSFRFGNHLDWFDVVCGEYKERLKFRLYFFFFQQNTLKTTLAEKI